MPLSPGSKLGPYEIVAPLTGAEGEAYKASDSRQNRTVTIRLLSAAISESAALRGRLEQETRAVSGLNHPHIGAVYDVGGEEKAAYVVAEYIEGETLAQRLSRGPLGLDEALKIGIALADALDKAHRLGVVHRNLNPSCVVLAETGVKLTGFGLVESLPAAGAPISASLASTRTSAAPAALAAPTAALPYVSPEQLEGNDGDARSDVFALGAILYEMVTGKPAFEGKTQALLVAAIQTIDPEPVSAMQPMAPAALDFAVQRCLIKDAKKRLPSAWDLLCQLQWIVEGGGAAAASTAAQAERRTRLYRFALAAAALLALALAPAAYLYFADDATPLQARFTLSSLGFSQGPGAGTPALSPDGRWLVTARMITDPGADAIALDSVSKQVLVPGTLTYMIFFKPDSQEIGFWGDGHLKAASINGGQARNIADVPPPFGGGTWSPSGDIVFSSAGLLYRVLAAGGEGVAISKLDETQQETEHLAPYFLPDGRHFLYLALSSEPSKSAVYVASLDSPERTRLFESQSRPFYADPGYILFNRGDVIFAWEFDADNLAMKGEPVRIADGVPPIGVLADTPMPMSLRESATYAVSQTGVLAYRTGGAPRGGGNTPTASSDGLPLSLVWTGPAVTPAPVGPPGTYAGLSLAPDGRRFAVHRHEGSGGDIWLYDPDQSGLQRWTTDVSQENSSPVWSPDGKRIAFASRRNGKWGVYIKAADRTGTEDRVLESDLPVAPMSWTQREELVYWVDHPKTLGDVWFVPLAGEREPMPVLQTNVQELYPQVSSDGKWIAYQAPDAAGVFQIWVNSFPNAQGAGRQITNDGARWPRWRTDGKVMQLFYDQTLTMMSVNLRVAGEGIQWDPPQALFGYGNPNLQNSSHYSLLGSYHRYTVSADGQRFLVPQPAATAPTGNGARGGMLADALTTFVDTRGGNAGGLPANEIAIVLNWSRLVKPQ